MKNKLIIILIMLMLPLAVSAVDENQISADVPVYAEDTAGIFEDIQYQDTENAQNIVQESETQPVTINEKANSLPYKQPISKKKLVKKFLFAMFAVGVSSLILYFGLTIYNKVRDNIPVQIKTPDDKTPLSSPEDLESAVDIFLDKTKWV